MNNVPALLCAFEAAIEQRDVELTTGAIASTRDFGAKQFKDAETLYGLLERQFEITHQYSDPQFARTDGGKGE